MSTKFCMAKEQMRSACHRSRCDDIFDTKHLHQFSQSFKLTSTQYNILLSLLDVVSVRRLSVPLSDGD